MEKSIKVRLKFDANSASKPMIYYFARNFDVVFSILQADIRPGTGGRTIMELRGEEDALERSLEYARSQGVDVKILSKAVVWNEKPASTAARAQRCASQRRCCLIRVRRSFPLTMQHVSYVKCASARARQAPSA